MLAQELSAILMKLTPLFFQMKYFGGKINGTTLAKYLIKTTVRSSFMRLRITGEINRTH